MQYQVVMKVTSHYCYTHEPAHGLLIVFIILISTFTGYRIYWILIYKELLDYYMLKKYIFFFYIDRYYCLPRTWFELW